MVLAVCFVIDLNLWAFKFAFGWDLSSFWVYIAQWAMAATIGYFGAIVSMKLAIERSR